MPVRRVDPSSPSAYPSLTKALSESAAGDVLLVTGGPFRENPVVRIAVAIRPQNAAQPFVLIGSLSIEGEAADLRLTGCTVQESAESGIAVLAGGKASLTRCTLANNRKYGVDVKLGGTLEARQCAITGNADAGVVTAGGARLTDCEMTGNGSSGAALFTGGVLTVSGGSIHDNASNGVWLNPQSSATIEGCDAYGNQRDCFGGTGTLEVHVCRIHDGGACGIGLTGDGRGTVVDSEIWSNAMVGVQAENGSGIDVSRCRIHDNARNAVFANGEESADAGGARITLDDCEIWGGAVDYPMVLAQHATVNLTRCRLRDAPTFAMVVQKGGQATVENCDLVRTGAEAAPAVMISASNATMRKCRIVASGGVGVYFLEGSKGAAEDCECVRSAASGFVLHGKSEVTLRQCRSHGNKLNGIFVGEGARAAIESCEVWDNGDEYPGISVRAAVAEMRSCQVHDNRAGGIQFDEQASGTIEQCDCRGNGGSGIDALSKAQLTVKGSKLYQNTANGIRFQSGAGGTLEGCETFDNQEVGVRVEACEVSLRDCRSHDNLQNGMFFLEGSQATIEQCEVWGGVDYPGISVSASRAVLRACTVHDVASNGIVFRQGASGRIEDCILRSNRLGGLVLVGATAELSGCHLSQNGQAGLWLLEKSTARLRNCTISENRPSGIDAQNGSTVDLTGCKVTHNSGHGLLLDGESHETHSGDCVLAPNGINAPPKPGTPVPQPKLPPRPPIAPPRPPAPSHDDIFAELDSLIGLQSVKDTMRKIRARVALAKGDMSKLDGLHSLFLGGPGTGKTTVARMMGRILHRMGAMTTDKVVVADGRKLVAAHIGHTAKLTQQRIDDAIGGVLLIDEAYALVNPDSPQDFGQEAVDTLVPQMEDHRSELVVIAAGYPDRMQKFIRSNPGLKERFRYTFYFEDYKPSELMQIFHVMLRQREVAVEDDVVGMVEQEFAARYEARDEEFGNARMVRGFISDALDNLAQRLAGPAPGEARLTLADVQPLCTTRPPEPRPVEEIMNELNGLVGLQRVKEQVLRVMETIQYERRLAEEAHGRFVKPVLHSLFLGNPGTGKTTVARLMGEIYKNMGLLARGHTITAERSDLVGQYTGHTAPKVKEVVRKALGGVLFIDEAYNLVLGEQDSFGREAIGALLTEMESRRDQFVLVAAGYPQEMERLLQSNSGLRSRFPSEYWFHFDDYSPAELGLIFDKLVRTKGLLQGPGVGERVQAEFSAAWKERTPAFGNGRAVRDYFQSVMVRVAARVNVLPAGTPLDVLQTIVAGDLDGCRLDRGGAAPNAGRRIGFS